MEDQGSDIEVTVKTLDSQSRSYSVGVQLTVKEFKEHISASVGIPVDKQRLIYQGRVLQDERTLSEYDVAGKVIHLVERAPPQTTHPSSGTGGISGPSQSPNTSTSSSQGPVHAPQHDRNANSYVMLGTFNVPVNIMDPQQIQMSIQQMMAGLGDSARNARVSTSTGTNGSMNVHIDMDQTIQSEPQVRLILAENLLRDANAIIDQIEGQPADASTQGESAPPPPSSSSSTPSPSSQPMDTSPPASSTSPPSSAETEGAPPAAPPAAPSAAPSAGLIHPSPAELVDMLGQLRRVEERLQPFIQRTHSILETATSADYNNNTQEREEDQRVLNLVGEALRLLGNALVALSDLRCNLLSTPPRHLHVVRPMTHYTSPVILPGGVHHIPIPINLGSGVSMPANRPAAEGQSEHPGQGQPPHPQPGSANHVTGQGPMGPRVIRISHQNMEPVVMMQMNLDDSGNASQIPGPQNQGGNGQQGTTTSVHIPGLPPEFMQAIVHQVTQQAMDMANAAAASNLQAQQQPTPGNTPSSFAPSSAPPPTAPPTQARVVFTRPSFTQRVPNPNFTSRGATFNVRAAVPPSVGQQPGQAGPLPPNALNQMITGLVGQILTGMSGQTAGQTTTSSSSHTFTSSSSTSSSSSSSTSSSSNSSSFSTFTPSSTSTSASSSSTTTSASDSTSSSTTHNSSSGSSGQPEGGTPSSQQSPIGGGLEQLLGSLLGAGVGVATGVPGPGGAPTITVTMPGGPAFIQGMTDFLQASQQAFTTQPGPQETAPSGGTAAPSAPPSSGTTTGGEGEALNPELFTGIVQGVLSTMMGSLGSQQGSTESIAQFIQRLSHTSNIFTPGTGDAVGFFGDLLTLVCQNISMVDMVLLLHGQHQPLSRIQPQLAEFFNRHFLNGQEPTEANITAAAEELVGELEEYIAESFSTVSVLEGVDITQTNLSFLRQQLIAIATHILHCTDPTFGQRLLALCNRGLFECLALNLYCLRGQQNSLTAVINHRIRSMSEEVNPSLVNWLTSMMTMRLQVILEHIPVTEDQIRHYVIHMQRQESMAPSSQAPEPQNVEMDDTLSPAPATTAEEAMVLSQETGAAAGSEPQESVGGEDPGRDSEAWAAALPPEWVPIIRHDLLAQRKMKTQPPLSDAYMQGMPAKRRKTSQGEGLHLSLSEAVSRAVRITGATPATSPERLQRELGSPELQEAYTQQMKNDISKRVQEDPDFNPKRFPNTHRAFAPDS
ncbi:large proline-rich protein BAG6 isoform X2 [Denticeps clupeoides]|uniref:large proline-rich protein BAG6 isoform X2 n=1 Tax=Denticeps clupeoides TaxID=299321 RepID=UPI0010A4A59F|nr:large proline-rich protein BAG6-like isoform X2 [Denticeps clupeoides]